MVFSSLSFLYILIPVTALLYFVIPSHTWRNAILLIASIVFYSWGEPKLVGLMLLATLVAYAGAILIDKYNDGRHSKLRKFIYILSIVLIVSNLVVFKYLGFIETNVEKIFGIDLLWPQLELPIGISFYTFQILSYVIDLYRGKVELQKNYFSLLLYVSFFPQLIAGPIVRYSTIEGELSGRKENIDDIDAGIKRFIIGLSKKVIIANGVAKFAEIVYAGDKSVYGTVFYWLAAIAGGLQLYFDFSGYSDMAIGLGRIFGFHFLENFEHPYTATSITDFWRKWHISLSSWFRDYVYIPLGGSHVSKSRWVFNILVVWGLTGLWHGASWNFVLWGLYYGVLLAIEKLLTGKFMDKMPKPLSWLITMFIVTIGWVIFNQTDLTMLTSTLGTMFSAMPCELENVISADAAIIEAALYMPIALVCIFPVGRLFRKLDESNFGSVITYAWYGVLLIICIIFLISNKYNPFIYFRF